MTDERLRRSLIPRPQGLELRRHRFYAQLLAITLALMVCFALPAGWGRLTSIGNLLLTLVLCLELGGAVGWGHRRRHPMDHLYRWLGLLCLAAQLLWMLTPLEARASGLPLLVFFTLFTVWSLKRLVECLGRERLVSQRVVAGALAGYLMLGISGGLLLSVLATIEPGAFLNTQGPSGMLPAIGEALRGREVWRIDFLSLNYFAFITMATVGYGDILPVTAAAKMASIGLSVAGPFYMAVVLGVLISRRTQQVEELERRDPEG